jgi:hypothetical protein
VIVSGGDAPTIKAMGNPAIRDYLRNAADTAPVVGSVCNGADPSCGGAAGGPPGHHPLGLPPPAGTPGRHLLSLLIVIMLLGHWLEMRALGQASGALDALAALPPDEADLVTGEGTRTVPISELTVGDVVLVRPGGWVPADGAIIEGEAELDESMVTGESRPVPKREGDRVVAGTVVTDSAVRAAAMLFYFAVGAGLITMTVWLALGEPDQAIKRTVTVLVIACPHALGAGHPAGDRHRDRAGGPQRHPGQGPPRPGADAHRRHGAVRQDRHPDQGGADRQRGGRSRWRRGSAAAAGRGGGGRQRAPAGPGDRGRRPDPGRWRAACGR